MKLQILGFSDRGSRKIGGFQDTTSSQLSVVSVVKRTATRLDCEQEGPTTMPWAPRRVTWDGRDVSEKKHLKFLLVEKLQFEDYMGYPGKNKKRRYFCQFMVNKALADNSPNSEAQASSTKHWDPAFGHNQELPQGCYTVTRN